MQDQNLDVNLIIQAFQEKVTQLTIDNIVKDATIKQLTMQLQQKQELSDGFDTPAETIKKVK
jgi:hypothetical protein